MKVLPRERLNTKTGTLTLQDARLPCDKRMVYAADGGSLYAEPAIRFPNRKEMDAEPAIRFSDQKDSTQKRAP